MALITSSLTTPALVTNLGEELTKVKLLFARGPEEPLNFKKTYKEEMAQARQAAIAAESAASAAPQVTHRASGPEMG